VPPRWAEVIRKRSTDLTDSAFIVFFKSRAYASRHYDSNGQLIDDTVVLSQQGAASVSTEPSASAAPSDAPAVSPSASDTPVNSPDATIAPSNASSAPPADSIASTPAPTEQPLSHKSVPDARTSAFGYAPFFVATRCDLQKQPLGAVFVSWGTLAVWPDQFAGLCEGVIRQRWAGWQHIKKSQRSRWLQGWFLLDVTSAYRHFCISSFFVVSFTFAFPILTDTT